MYGYTDNAMTMTNEERWDIHYNLRRSFEARQAQISAAIDEDIDFMLSTTRPEGAHEWAMEIRWWVDRAISLQKSFEFFLGYVPGIRFVYGDKARAARTLSMLDT